MKFLNFIKDKRHFFLFIFLSFFLLNSVCLLDERFQIEFHNLFYLNSLLFVLVFIYLLAGYIKRKIYFKDLLYYLEVQKEINPQALPKPQTEEHLLFNMLFEKVYLKNLERIHKLESEKKEYEEFIDSWVHSIKTPITVSYLLLEKRTPDNSLQKELKEELSKIEYYVDQALYYSKSDDFSKDFLLQELYLDDLLKKVIKKESGFFINKKINPQLEVPHVQIKSDSKWLFFILTQIVNNALKYSDVQGTILFQYEKNDFCEMLHVEDYGIGIQQADLQRVFEKGFTGNNGRKYSKSTGIGLYLAQKLALKLGHKITVSSVSEKFTRFTVHFATNSEYYL